MIVYYDHRGHGHPYSKLMAELILTKIVKEYMDRQGVGSSFIDPDLITPLHDTIRSINHVGSYKTDAAMIQCFVPSPPAKPEYIIFIVGDEYFGSIKNTSESGHAITDLMFEVVGIKADPSLETIIFGNENYATYVFRIKRD